MSLILRKNIIDYLIEMGRVIWPHDLAWAELELSARQGGRRWLQSNKVPRSPSFTD